MITARDRRGRRLLLTTMALLLVMIVVSLMIGARPVAPAVVIDALLRPDLSLADHSVILTQRVPRTIIGILAGASLALAGTLMQGLTRNPLADPGLLGVNSGASVAVLAAIARAARGRHVADVQLDGGRHRGRSFMAGRRGRGRRWVEVAAGTSIRRGVPGAGPRYGPTTCATSWPSASDQACARTGSSSSAMKKPTGPKNSASCLGVQVGRKLRSTRGS